MLFVLLIGLILLLVIAYQFNNKRIFNPSCIICIVFIFSNLVAIGGNVWWHYQMHFSTISFIWLSIFIFIIGSSISTAIINYFVNDEEYENYCKCPQMSFVIIITVLLLLLSTHRIRTVLSGGWQGLASFGSSLKQARDSYFLGRSSSSPIDAIAMFFSRAVAYICIYKFFYLLVVQKVTDMKKNLYLWLPSIPYLLNAVLSTGRTLLIYYIGYILLVYGILLTRLLHLSGQTIRRFIRVISIGILAIFGLFVGLQYLRQGLHHGDTSIFNILSTYAGLSIPALDKYLTNGVKHPSIMGTYTLGNFYDMLKSFGIAAPKVNGALEPVSINGYVGNIFTTFRRYVADYSYSGNYFIMLLLGIITSLFFNVVFKKKNHQLLLIIYSTLIYPIFEFSIEERFMSDELGTAPIYNTVALIICWIVLNIISFKAGKYQTLNVVGVDDF